MRQPSSNNCTSRGRSVLTKWAVSYFLILLIPNLVFLYSYRVTVSTMQSEIRGANQLVLGNLQGNIDRLLADAKEAYAYTYSTKQFSQTKQYSQNNSRFHYEAYQLMQALGSYASGNNKKIKILIYFRDLDYLITESTANEGRYLYEAQLFSGISVSYDDWIAVLQKEYANEFFLSSHLQIGSAEPCFIYANTIRRAAVNVSIFITVPLSSAEEYSSGLGDRTLTIHTRDGQYVTSFGNPVSMDFIDFSFPSGSEIHDANGAPYICMYSPSVQAGWIYSIVAPESSFFKVSKSLGLLFIGSLFASLLLGVSLVWLLLRRNYKPVGSILSVIGHSDASGDEFELIKNSYNQLASENHTMQSTLTKQAEQLRERYILSRLKGKKTYLDNMDASSYFQIDIQNKSFVLAAFSVGSFSDGASGVYQDELEYHNINMFAVDNVFSEMMGGYSFYRVEDGQLLLYLLCFSPIQKDLWECKGSAKISEICEIFNYRLSVPLTAAVSKPTDNFGCISLLYSDVMDALEYKNIIGENGIILTADLKETDLLINKNVQDVRELADAVGKGDYEKAKSIITEVFEENRTNTALPFAVFRILTMNYLNAALNAFYDSVLDISQYNKQLVSRLEPLTASSEMDSLYCCSADFLYFICQVITKQNEGTESKLTEKIRNYILAHYQDSNLNISMIADEIERSPRYISHVFRIQTGVGLLDYINQIRIKKAKDIMEREDITMEELAKRVGYTNDRTFRRAFFRVEGTSPSKYINNETV